MTEQKHTPGPWNWCMGLQHHVTVGEISGTKIPAENLIANVPSGRANARLIAAAPEMLTLVIQYRDDMRHPIWAEVSRERRLEVIEAMLRRTS